MGPSRSKAYLEALVRELCSLSYETEWIEFKVNNARHAEVGEYISALSNGAALNEKPYAYLVWGIEDQTHAIVGTTFFPHTAKEGNEPLENWLLRRLSPQVDFQFHEVSVDEHRIVVLEISAASQSPVAFGGVRFIRIGSVKKKLMAHPAKEQALWQSFERRSFEDRISAERISDQEVLLQLDYPSYFKLLSAPLPNGHAAILDALRRDDVIQSCDAGGWNITNLGAMLFASNISDFGSIRRKAMRVIQYSGTGRTDAQGEEVFAQGYASGFQSLIDYIVARIPSNEIIEQSLRRTVPMFPEIAVRELVSNALIHQDLSVSGAGPLLEIFDDRIEITNPGMPLVETDRFIDGPPQSRNEKLAALMRRFGICEERGRGIDTVVEQVEIYQLPAPLFESVGGFTKATLFAHKTLSEMDEAERVRACYMHACLRQVMNQATNNSSIRQRFGISKANSAQASRLLKRALDSGWITLRDPNAGPRQRAYLPFWASPRNGGPVT